MTAPSSKSTRGLVKLGKRAAVCPEHGAYDSQGLLVAGGREIWTPCTECFEAARRLELRERAAAVDAAAARKAAALVGQACIPERFIGRTFDNFEATTPGQRRVLAACRQFAEDFEETQRLGTVLVLSGRPGTGKSHLAAAILQALLPAHVGMYATCMDLIRAVRDTWRSGSETSESALLHRLGSLPLLVLDEVGVQYGTAGEQTILFDVLDRRYRRIKPTVLLTNEAMAGLRAFLGDRLHDRLKEVGRWEAFDWESYRPQARAKRREL